MLERRPRNSAAALRQRERTLATLHKIDIHGPDAMAAYDPIRILPRQLILTLEAPHSSAIRAYLLDSLGPQASNRKLSFMRCAADDS